MQYVRANSFLKFNGVGNVQRWCVDRNTALYCTFWGVKYGKIFFPRKEDSGHYVSDLLSPYEHIRELSSGMMSKTFLRDPSRPDDFAHALTFASVMAMQLIGDPMMNLVPETAMEYTGTEFPETGVTDVSDMMGGLNKG